MIKPKILIVMGVSGSGKTSIAVGLHEKLGWLYQEGDELHPKANVAKMSAGIPLDDEDRWPWLDRCADWIRARHDAGEPGILTCSALRRCYRDVLSKASPDVWYLYIDTPPDVLRERLAHRKGHYMPSSLLPTQLQTLEVPEPPEQVIRIVPPDNVAETVALVMDRLETL